MPFATSSRDRSPRSGVARERGVLARSSGCSIGASPVSPSTAAVAFHGLLRRERKKGIVSIETTRRDGVSSVSYEGTPFGRSEIEEENVPRYTQPTEDVPRSPRQRRNGQRYLGVAYEQVKTEGLEEDTTERRCIGAGRSLPMRDPFMVDGTGRDGTAEQGRFKDARGRENLCLPVVLTGGLCSRDYFLSSPICRSSPSFPGFPSPDSTFPRE